MAMKVLYLAPQPKREGPLTAYSFLDEEIRALAGAGVRAYVLSRRTQAPREDHGVVRWPLRREQSLRGRGESMPFMLRSSAGMHPANLLSFGEWYRAALVERTAAQVIEQEKIDVVHSHFAWPNGLGGSLARRATGVPLVACLRGADILVDEAISYGARDWPFFDRNLKRLLKTADRTLYFSEFMREEAIGLGAPAERAQTVQKAVDLSQFRVIEDRPKVRRELGFGDRPMILTVGGLIPRKGIDVILHALAGLRQKHDFSFVICGDGPEREALQGLARQLSLEDRTHFMGVVNRDEIPKFFGACEIFVLASVLEAAGNVLFEAMGAGRPIVCTRAGGPGEYVEDGVTGFVVPIRDSAALGARIDTLLTEPVLRDRLGEAGRQRALTKFAYPRLIRDIISVYEQVVRQRGAAQPVSERSAEAT
jgi:glycosyltransferase involved in cell wall biosynthesis